MKYVDAITRQMNWLGEQDGVVFIGQGLLKGDRIYQTMKDVPISRCLEMPIAENLIMGTAIGLAMDGWKPVVIFQRMDFMLIAADQIINHLTLIKHKSNEQYNPKVIIRACIGSQCERFDVGAQHKHDFREVFKSYIETVDFKPEVYERAFFNSESTIIVEEKDLYETNCVT